MFFLNLLLACNRQSDKQEKGDNGSSPNLINGVLYDTIITFSHDAKHLVHALKENDSIGFIANIIDTTTDQIIGETYWFDNGPDLFSNGVARFKKGNRIGLVNYKGEIVLMPKYQMMGPINAGYAIVGDSCIYEENGEHTSVTCAKYGIIDSAGNEKLPVIYKDIHVGKLPIGVDSNMNQLPTQPKDMNYHLFYKRNDVPCGDNYKDMIIYAPFSESFWANGKTIFGGVYESFFPDYSTLNNTQKEDLYLRLKLFPTSTQSNKKLHFKILSEKEDFQNCKEGTFKNITTIPRVGYKIYDEGIRFIIPFFNDGSLVECGLHSEIDINIVAKYFENRDYKRVK